MNILISEEHFFSLKKLFCIKKVSRMLKVLHWTIDANKSAGFSKVCKHNMHSHYTIRRVKTDSNLQTIEDWISSDMELSKSKGDSMTIWFTLVSHM